MVGTVPLPLDLTHFWLTHWFTL